MLLQVRPLPLKVDSGANIAPFNEEAIMEDPEVCATGETKGGSLLDGTYDEQGSAQSFQDAVKEWRNGRNVVVKSKGKRDVTDWHLGKAECMPQCTCLICTTVLFTFYNVSNRMAIMTITKPWTRRFGHH